MRCDVGEAMEDVVLQAPPSQNYIQEMVWSSLEIAGLYIHNIGWSVTYTANALAMAAEN